MKAITGFLLLLISALFTFGQEAIQVDELMKTMSKGSQNAYVSDIPQAKLKDVSSAWKKYVRHETKNSVGETNGEIIMTGTMVPNITSNPLNIYARLLETDKGVKVTAFFTEDDSVFISSRLSEEKSMAVKKFIRDFVIQQYKAAVYHELDAEKKKLSKLEDDLDNLIRANEKANKRINEDNRQIDKDKDALAVNRKEQEARAGEIANQKEAVRSLAGSAGEEKDLAEKNLKGLEKEKKKLENQSEKLHSDIEDLESDIHRQQRNIDKNEDEQKAKKEDISLQKDVIRNVEKKVNNIL